jgi:hypothetical protein
VLLLICVKVSRKKGHSTINLITMIKLQGPNLLNRLLKRWWLSLWAQCHRKLLGKKLVYMLKVFLGYERILDPRGAQTLERRMNQKE